MKKNIMIPVIIALLIGGVAGFVGNMQYQKSQEKASMKTIDKISMFFLVVKDVEKAKSFYVDQLGFTATKDYEQANDRWVTIVPPGGGTEITLTNDPEDFKVGTIKIYLSTPDVKKAYAELTARGITPKTEIKDDIWGSWFSVEDPDGNRWLVVEWRF